MILVDTNVVSEPLRPKPSEAAVAWLDANFEMCAVSTITMMELAIGVSCCRRVDGATGCRWRYPSPSAVSAHVS